MASTYSSLSNEQRLFINLMDFAEEVGPHEFRPGFNTYRIEFPKKGIGFVIIARKRLVAGVENTGDWEVHNWTTYNV